MGPKKGKGKAVPLQSPSLPAKMPVDSPIRDEQLRFRFDMLHPHRWRLSSIEQRHVSALLAKLAYFEKMTVSQARQGGFLADYDLTAMTNKNAVAVWRQHVGDEYDSMSRLTVEKSGSLRLMGARINGEFHIVFWDPSHEIFPDGGKNVR